MPVTHFSNVPYMYGDPILLGQDRKSTRLNSSHSGEARMPSYARKNQSVLLLLSLILTLIASGCAGVFVLETGGIVASSPDSDFFFKGHAPHRDLHVLTHSFPTRRSSDLAPVAPIGWPSAMAPPSTFTISSDRPSSRDRKSTRLNSSHSGESRMPSSA